MKPLFLGLLAAVLFTAGAPAADLPDGRYLYVAVPGIRNYLEHGGHGLLVFDIDRDYRFVKRIYTHLYCNKYCIIHCY